MARTILMGADHRITSHATAHVNAIKRLTSAGSVIDDEGGRTVYGGDAQSRFSDLPMAVVLPRSTDEVAAVLGYCHQAGVKVFPRGGGTSMVGGAVPAPDGIVLCLSRMSRVLETDFESLLVRVEAGITTAAVTEAVRAEGFRYLPDPASASASTIAGNIATAASGARALRDSGTMPHVAGLRIVRTDGDVVEVGAGYLDAPGYDLLGVIGGSEGQLGVVTEAILRIAPMPPATETLVVGFGGAVGAVQYLAAIVASGLHPCAMAYLERAAIAAIEQYAGAGLPDDVAALVLIETEGTDDECTALSTWLEETAQPFEPRVVKRSADRGQSELMWRGQQAVCAAMGQVSDYLCAEGVVPVSRLAGCVTRIAEIGEAHTLRVVTVMQGGDGGLTPFILFDGNDAGESERAEQTRGEILAHFVEVGGSIAGEFGIGLEKREQMSLQFTTADLSLQARIRGGFDPAELLNPGKVLPLSIGTADPSMAGMFRRRASGGLR